MKVEYRLDPSDLIAFSQEHRRLAPDSLSRVYYFVVLPALGVALAVTTESLLLATSFTALYMLSGWGFQSLIRQRFWRAIFSNENIAFGAGPWQATLAEEGATFSCEAAVTLYRWPAIREVFRGSNYIYFVLTPLYRVHIPVRAFSDEEHLKTFLSAAQAYAKK